jgi:ABC-type transporter Mla MlaB component
MVFRISQLNGHRRRSPVTLRLEGQLDHGCVEELTRACRAHADRPERLTLDVAGVTYIDEAGVALMRQFKNRNIAVVGASPFIRELLKERTS